MSIRAEATASAGILTTAGKLLFSGDPARQSDGVGSGDRQDPVAFRAFKVRQEIMDR